jgi:hypothetical protein
VMKFVFSIIFTGFFFCAAFADSDEFDMSRWTKVMDDVRARATVQNISESTINDTLRSPAFIPSIVKSDKNQSDIG